MNGEQAEAAITEAFIAGALHNMDAKEVAREYAVDDADRLIISVTARVERPIDRLDVVFTAE